MLRETDGAFEETDGAFEKTSDFENSFQILVETDGVVERTSDLDASLKEMVSATQIEIDEIVEKSFQLAGLQVTQTWSET